MALMIDASVFIAEERGASILSGLVARQPDCAVALAALTAAELLQGVYRATREDRARREAFVEHILVTLPVIAFDMLAARTYARLAAELAAAGVRMAPHHLNVAATALAGGYIVATRDQRSFRRIPGLKVIVC